MMMSRSSDCPLQQKILELKWFSLKKKRLEKGMICFTKKRLFEKEGKESFLLFTLSVMKDKELKL